MNFKHGMSETREFKTWLRMIDRCRNDRQGTYGKRGIAVCPRWLESFENFYEDMGEIPSPNHSIDRIDVRGNYEPGNCRWATSKEQARNTTKNTVLKMNGESATIAEWAERTGIKPSTICRRLASGLTVDKALELFAEALQSEYERGQREAAERCAEIAETCVVDRGDEEWAQGRRDAAASIRREFGLSEKGEAR